MENAGCKSHSRQSPGGALKVLVHFRRAAVPSVFYTVKQKHLRKTVLQQVKYLEIFVFYIILLKLLFDMFLAMTVKIMDVMTLGSK